MKEVNVKLCVVELIGTERLADSTLISLLLEIDGGNVACEAILARVVLWVFYLIHRGERIVHCGTDESHELIEIYWL